MGTITYPLFSGQGMGNTFDPLWLDQIDPAEVYKSDGRSRVWRMESPIGDLVVKRFEYSPQRQRFAWWLRCHPVQREARSNALLHEVGMAVLPIVAMGWSGRAWVVWPRRGESLHDHLYFGRLETPARRHHLTRQVADLTSQLLEYGLALRDFKLSNILVDEADRLWLIDTAGLRRTRSRRVIWRMLTVLDRTAVRAGARRTDRVRFLRKLLDGCPDLPMWKAAVRAVRMAGKNRGA